MQWYLGLCIFERSHGIGQLKGTRNHRRRYHAEGFLKGGVSKMLFGIQELVKVPFRCIDSTEGGDS